MSTMNSLMTNVRLRKAPSKILSVFWSGCVTLLAALPASAQSVDQDLATLFENPANWSVKAEAFVSEHRDIGFRFVDGHTMAMSSDRSKLKFHGASLCEARVYFEADAISRVELSIYNKGDAGAMEADPFGTLVNTTKSNIAQAMKDKGSSGSTTSPRPNYFVNQHLWKTTSPAILMEWAFIKPHRSGGKNVDFGAEFIKVLLVPNQAASTMASASGGTSAMILQNSRDIKKNITKNADGDVWVANIPMVDQGQKGYCAAATSERILRYFGLAVDQHQIAQIANTAAEGGTSFEGMDKAITLVGRQFMLDKKDLLPTSGGGSFEGSMHAKVIEQYNTVAKRNKKPEIDWKKYLSNNTINLQKIWDDMDPEILLVARSNQKQALAMFFQNIKHYTEEGVPVVWSCLVGMYPEQPAINQHGAFGHIRLILGYNEKKNEVLYSDSWGIGHEIKRLPVDKAWAMTKGLVVLKPRNVR